MHDAAYILLACYGSFDNVLWSFLLLLQGLVFSQQFLVSSWVLRHVAQEKAVVENQKQKDQARAGCSNSDRWPTVWCCCFLAVLLAEKNKEHMMQTPHILANAVWWGKLHCSHTCFTNIQSIFTYLISKQAQYHMCAKYRNIILSLLNTPVTISHCKW